MLIDLVIKLDKELYANYEDYKSFYLVVSDLFGNDYTYTLEINTSNNVIEKVFE